MLFAVTQRVDCLATLDLVESSRLDMRLVKACANRHQRTGKRCYTKHRLGDIFPFLV